MSTPLRTLVDDLLHDPSARASFAADPAGYLDQHGWDDLDGADVGTALDVMRQELPIDEAVRLGTVDADSFGEGAAGAITGLQAAAAAFDVDWSADPAMTLDDVREPDAIDVDEDASGRFEFPLSEDSNLPEVDTEPDVEELDEPVFDDPLDAIGEFGEPEAFTELDLDEWPVTDIEDGIDDG